LPKNTEDLGSLASFYFPDCQPTCEPPPSISTGFHLAAQPPLVCFSLDGPDDHSITHLGVGGTSPSNEIALMDAHSKTQDERNRKFHSAVTSSLNNLMENSLTGEESDLEIGMPNDLTGMEDWQKECVDVFKKLDADNSGSLSASEVRTALRAAGVPLARLNKLIRLTDANHDGEIDMSEWLKALKNPNEEFQELRKLSSDLRYSLQTLNSTQKLEFVGNDKRTRWMLKPHSSIRVAFDLALMCSCFYIAIVLPFDAAWEGLISPGALNVFQWIDRFIGYLFLIDIILNFRTAYYNSDGELVVDPKSIAKQYLGGWFCLDIASSVPFEDLTQNKTVNLQAFKLLKLGRLLKLLKLVKIWARSFSFDQFSDTLDDIAHSSFMRILKRKYLVFVQALLVTHWLACGMKLVDEGFLSGYKDVCDNLWREYLAALYWALTTLTTVGYGDISPSSDAERAYTILAMVIGGGFYGYVVGSISSLVSNSDLNASAYYDRLDLIHAWLEHHNMPAELRRTLRRFFQASLHERSAIKESDIWQDLTPELQNAVGEHIIHTHVKNNPLFDGMSMSSVVHLQSVLRKLTIPAGCVINTKGETGTAMYIIVSGVLEMTKEDGTSEHLGAGQSFGEEVLLGFVSEYTYDIKVLETVKVEMIVESEFTEGFRNLPNDLQKMRKNALTINPDWIYEDCPISRRISQVSKASTPRQTVSTPRH
jgi:hypothetical protein